MNFNGSVEVQMSFPLCKMKVMRYQIKGSVTKCGMGNIKNVKRDGNYYIQILTIKFLINFLKKILSRRSVKVCTKTDKACNAHTCGCTAPTINNYWVEAEWNITISLFHHFAHGANNSNKNVCWTFRSIGDLSATHYRFV